MTRLLLRALNGPLLLFFVLVGIAIQSSLFSSWLMQYLQPDIVLLVVVWVALRRGFTEGGILTLIMAEMSEIHSASPRGLCLISYMVVYLAIRSSARILVIPSLFSTAMLAVLATGLWKLVSLLVLYLLGSSGNLWVHTLKFLLVGPPVEGVFAIWAYRWLERFDWITFKNAKAERVMEEELQLDSEGF